MLFGGIGQHVEMQGNTLVGVPLQHQRKHFALTGTQTRPSAANFVVPNESF